MFATIVLAGADGAIPFGVSRLLAGGAFGLGLILVVVGGAELFTGNTLMVMALAARRITLREMLRAWLLVYLGNLAGSFGTASLVLLSGQYAAGQGSVGLVALKLAVQKALLQPDQAFFLGILCNVLVCLAVWLSIGARSTTDKILAVIFPISAFVAAGFEHSVANMYIMPLGMMIKWFAPDTFWTSVSATPSIVANLIPVTAGNIIGGGVLVGLVYWFVYLRRS
jgi:formate/nitrite transporter